MLTFVTKGFDYEIEPFLYPLYICKIKKDGIQ